MQGRDNMFGNILENVMSNVEEAEAQEVKVAEMVEFYGKVLEGSTPYDAIVKLAKEREMKPEDVFEMLKAGGHVNTETLEELKVPGVEESKERELTEAEKEVAKADEKIGEPKAEKAPDMKPKGGADHSSLKQIDAMGAKVSHKPDTKMGGPAGPKSKIGEPKAEKPKELKGANDLGKLQKVSDGKIPEEGKDDEKTKIDKLTEIDSTYFPVEEPEKTPGELASPGRSEELSVGGPDYVISDVGMIEEIELSLEGMTNQELLDAYNSIVAIPGNEITIDQVQWSPERDTLEGTYREILAKKLIERKAVKEVYQNMSEGALAKEVDSLATAAKKALDADEYDTAMDLVSRLAQVQAALPAKVEPIPAAPSVEAPIEEPENKEGAGPGDETDERKIKEFAELPEGAAYLEDGDELRFTNVSVRFNGSDFVITDMDPTSPAYFADKFGDRSVSIDADEQGKTYAVEMEFGVQTEDESLVRRQTVEEFKVDERKTFTKGEKVYKVVSGGYMEGEVVKGRKDRVVIKFDGKNQVFAGESIDKLWRKSPGGKKMNKSDDD